jgi:hypothetical protein
MVHVDISYYNLANFLACVSVCVSVCLAIRFHSYQRIFSKFGGKPSTGHYTFRGLYSLCVHATRARARAVRMYEARAHVTLPRNETNLFSFLLLQIRIN